MTLASILLFGPDQLIYSVLPQHKTDALLRVYDTDRYDDRDMIETNLLDSYDRLMAFGKKHLNDLFVLDGDTRVSARDRILREVVGNLLCHRDFSSGYIASMTIYADRLETKNGNVTHGFGFLKLESFKPFAKNPVIADVFRNIGWADELGSGMRNTFKFTKLYSGGEPSFEEGDMFITTVPLTNAATGVKVGLGSHQYLSSTEAGTEVKLEAARLSALLDFCSEPRTRQEMQEFCKIKTEKYFREKVLQPMLKHGMIFRTIPDKPKSPKQKYYSK